MAALKFALPVASVLALSAPARCPPANLCHREGPSVARAASVRPPAFVKKPSRWRIRKVYANSGQRLRADSANRCPKPLNARCGKRSPSFAWIDACSPENLIRHPITDPRKHGLIEQRGLHCEAGVALEKQPQTLQRKFIRCDCRRQSCPPLRRVSPTMEKHATKHTWIAENERLLSLEQRKVIVLAGLIRCGFDPQHSTHSKMKTEPTATRKTEEQFFPMRLRSQQSSTFHGINEECGLCSAKEASSRVERDATNFLAEPRIPLPPIKLDFRQFGHREEEPCGRDGAQRGASAYFIRRRVTG